MTDARTNDWFTALENRHGRTYSRPELLKAIRALSVRYVERRASFVRESPLDSAGKRAAFALFYGPLHYTTTLEILKHVGTRGGIRSIVDLGCGTGVAGAAWASLIDPRPSLVGVDELGWAVEETNWNWRALGLTGRARRGDLVDATVDLLDRRSQQRLETIGTIFAWSVNELADDRRTSLLPRLIELARRGTAVLVIEPIARRITPWYDRWRDEFVKAGGRADEWKFTVDLPPKLAALDRDAGFDREELSAKSLAVNVTPAPLEVPRGSRSDEP
jgi:hypothetical protein